MAKPIIICGGQTGADRAALDIALRHRLPYCGYIPQGRLAEDGTVPEYYTYLKENKNADYSSRTLKNVLIADAVVLFFKEQMDEGTRLTQALADRFHKPSLAVDLNQRTSVNELDEFIENYELINFAGSRESNSPGIYNSVYRLLDKVFQKYL